jgi:hypothetical protein
MRTQEPSSDGISRRRRSPLTRSPSITPSRRRPPSPSPNQGPSPSPRHRRCSSSSPVRFRADEKGKQAVRGSGLPSSTGAGAAPQIPDNQSAGSRAQTVRSVPELLVGSASRTTPSRVDLPHAATTTTAGEAMSSQPGCSLSSVNSASVIRDYASGRVPRRIRNPRHRTLLESVRAHLHHLPAHGNKAPKLDLLARPSDAPHALSSGGYDDNPVRTHGEGSTPHDDGARSTRADGALSPRARLLGRLEDARRACREDDSPASTIVALASFPVPVPGAHVPSDLREIEGRLRTQAQLRIRLAAARRAATVGDGCGGHEGGAETREDALRAQLRRR